MKIAASVRKLIGIVMAISFLSVFIVVGTSVYIRLDTPEIVINTILFFAWCLFTLFISIAMAFDADVEILEILTVACITWLYFKPDVGFIGKNAALNTTIIHVVLRVILIYTTVQFFDMDFQIIRKFKTNKAKVKTKSKA